MPNKKAEEPNEIFKWKSSLPKMADIAITKFIYRPIEKNQINKEKGLTMTFVREQIYEKNLLA